jgi:hypothetical protein
MPLLRRETGRGPVLVRPPFLPNDYAAPSDALRLFERWNDSGAPEPGVAIPAGSTGSAAEMEDAETLLALRGGPFGNYVEVGRRERAGRPRIVLLETSREFAVEVEARTAGFGEVLALPPREAYDLARARDPLRSLPVLYED